LSEAVLEGVAGAFWKALLDDFGTILASMLCSLYRTFEKFSYPSPLLYIMDLFEYLEWTS
jgi:hypothetical protein